MAQILLLSLLTMIWQSRHVQIHCIASQADSQYVNIVFNFPIQISGRGSMYITVQHTFYGLSDACYKNTQYIKFGVYLYI